MKTLLKPPLDPQRIDALNRGEVEAKNLMESLAIDFHRLIGHLFPKIKLPPFEKKLGITKKMQLTSQALYQQQGIAIIDLLTTHPSDTLRCMVSYILALHSHDFDNHDFEWILSKVQPLADDLNSGVREWAWMGIRPLFAKDPLNGIALLKPWTKNPSERIRRFASELSRPRGVWCAHVQELRQAPWAGLPLLEALKNDPARYVQLSVGNWLNDAGKDHPAWVQELCSRWKSESPTLQTEKICKRGLRNL